MNRNSNAIKVRSSVFGAKRFEKDYNSNADLVQGRSIIRSEEMFVLSSEGGQPREKRNLNQTNEQNPIWGFQMQSSSRLETYSLRMKKPFMCMQP